MTMLGSYAIASPFPQRSPLRPSVLLASAADDADGLPVGGQRQLPPLQRQRLLPEQRAPPALQRRYVGLVVAGDALQVAAVGDQPRRDVAFFAVVLEQHLAEIGQRPPPGRPPLRQTGRPP